ncbi:MAG: aminotransferase class I/II-fold pyridoxal phosphate-dependent enzyme [Thiotrichales bacterium]|nr:aminotransferase class I/II-fold pyridoxal phosphate-dependent enzyme [Thiotrichales bacterium]
MSPNFEGNFTQQLPIPEEAIERAVAVMRSGRLHRYNVADGEVPETVRLENEFAAYMGARFCLACTSGGYALQTALRAFGVSPGEPVLTNGFTLSPVPGAIEAAGGKAVLVEITEDLVIDLDDLVRKAQSSGARVLMLSHMRGHIVDMGALMDAADSLGIAVIEDCAHTMGARWGNTKSGAHGLAACFSTQTYKHINSGEGGFITSDDEELMARATILSGSYMLYGRHDAVPDGEVFDRVRLETPNCSGRLDNLRAAILRPQLAELDSLVEAWNVRYRAIESVLRSAPGVRLPERPEQEAYVGSSLQFRVSGLGETGIRELVKTCNARGVELKWFGDPEPVAFTSRYDSWRYLEQQSLPVTDRVLASLLDMRIPLTFSVEDCRLIGRIITECLATLRTRTERGRATPAAADAR